MAPEKTKRGRSNGKEKVIEAPKDVNLLSRITCLLGDPGFFDLWTSYNRGASCDAQDAKEIGVTHNFIKKMAAAAVNAEWTNADGSPHL